MGSNPWRTVIIDALPGQVTFDKYGQPWAAPPFAIVILPALPILGNLLYGYLYWKHS